MEVKAQINKDFGKCKLLINGAGGNNKKAQTVHEEFEIGDETATDIQTFFNMAQSSSGVIEISALSEGMYQAMVTTVGGLIVGILAMFAYNFLVSRIDRVVRQLESRTMEFMDLLNEPA